MAKLSFSYGFTKGVSVDVLYLKINDIVEYNPPYIQSDFMCNPTLCAIRVRCLKCVPLLGT